MSGVKLIKSTEKSYALVKNASYCLHGGLVFRPVLFAGSACLPREEYKRGDGRDTGGAEAFLISASTGFGVDGLQSLS